MERREGFYMIDDILVETRSLIVDYSDGTAFLRALNGINLTIGVLRPQNIIYRNAKCKICSLPFPNVKSH